MSSHPVAHAALLALCLAASAPASAIAPIYTMYNNGADTLTNAANISFGYQVSNSFTLSNAATLVTGVTFSNWVFSGDAPVSVDWAITTGALSGPVLAYGTGTPLSATFSRTILVPVVEVYADVYNASFSLNTTLNPGTYYLQLGNEITSSNSGGFWGESGGPSLAVQYDPTLPGSYSIASSSFKVTSPVPEPANIALLLAGLGLMVLRFRGKA
jgi:hypothetical protein